MAGSPGDAPRFQAAVQGSFTHHRLPFLTFQLLLTSERQACGCRLSQEWPILGSNCQVHSCEGFLVLFVNMGVEGQVHLNSRKCVRIRCGCLGKKMKPSSASSSHKNIWGQVLQNWSGSVKNVPSFLLYLLFCVTSVLKATLCFRTAARAPAVTATCLAAGSKGQKRIKQ